MYFLTEIRVSDFDAGAASAQGRFKVVSPCSDAKRRDSAKVFEAVKGLQGNDQRQALQGLKMLLKLAQLGKPFNQLSDAKTVHEAFAPFYCDVTKKDETVWRYRHGDIRFCFITRPTRLSCWRTHCPNVLTSFQQKTSIKPSRPWLIF